MIAITMIICGTFLSRKGNSDYFVGAAIVGLFMGCVELIFWTSMAEVLSR